MAYNFKAVYVTAEGRKRVVDCLESANIALGICKIQLARGAQSAIVEVSKVAETDQKPAQ